MDVNVLSTACSLITSLLSASLAVYIFKRDSMERYIQSNKNSESMVKALHKFNHDFVLIVVGTGIFAIIFDFIGVTLSYSDNHVFISLFWIINAVSLSIFIAFFAAALEPKFEMTLAKNMHKFRMTRKAKKPGRNKKQ